MPIALVVPVYQGIVRTYACLVSIAFYLFIALCLGLGIFNQISTFHLLLTTKGLFTWAPIFAGIALLPSQFWDSIFVTISAYVAPSI